MRRLSSIVKCWSLKVFQDKPACDNYVGVLIRHRFIKVWLKIHLAAVLCMSPFLGLKYFNHVDFQKEI